MTKKKYKKVIRTKSGKKKIIRYGAKGYRIKPGTKAGDSFCARTWGLMKKYPKAAKNPNSPLRLSRKKWRCKGKKSVRKKK